MFVTNGEITVNLANIDFFFISESDNSISFYRVSPNNKWGELPEPVETIYFKDSEKTREAYNKINEYINALKV
jgi:hypothetical protein